MEENEQLQNLDGGKAWKYMLANHFDSLRSGALVVCEIRHIVPSVSPTDTLTLIQNQQGSEKDSLQQKDAQDTASQLQVYPGGNAAETENAAHVSGRDSYYALKTNLLYDALLVPNLGIETSIGRDGPSEPAVCSPGGARMPATNTGESTVEKWKSESISAERPRKNRCRDITSPLYGQLLTYDIENGGTGSPEQGKPTEQEWSTDTHCR